MPLAVQLLFAIAAMSFVAWTIVAVVHVDPWLARRSRRDALLAVMTPQMFRHVGVFALYPGIAAVPPEWSGPLARGDYATALLAAISMVALHRGARAAIPLTWVATTFGTLDLLHNVFNAMRLGVPPLLGPMAVVAGMVVPGMLVCHVLAVRILLRSRETAEGARP